LFSTVLSLLFVPAMFLLMDDIGSLFGRLGRKLLVSSGDSEAAAGDDVAQPQSPTSRIAPAAD